MQHRSAAFLPFLLVCGLSAQGVTSPKGYDTTEGNMIFYHWNGTRRFQQIDNTHKGTPFVVKSISFRRDGTGGGANATARTFNVSADMGYASWGVASTVMDDNFLAGTKTNVFTYKSVSMPDWTAVPTPPAAFDFTLVYDAMWPYTGTSALVWTVSYDSGPSGQAQTDRQYVAAGPTSSAGTALGTGCIATGNASAFGHTMTFSNFGASGGMALTGGVTLAPASTPVTLFLDGVNSNLTIPGLCSVLYALPTIQLPLGTSSATGAITQRVYQVPYNAGIQGGTLFTQCMALDVGQPGYPIVVSNGRQTTMPAAPVGGGTECLYQWSTLPTVTGSPTYGGGIVAFLGF